MKNNISLRRYHAATWDEPVIMEMGRPGRRGIAIPEPEEGIAARVGDGRTYIPTGMQRKHLPKLPELSQFEVLRHYLHLSQMTLGMMGISLFGTCTMKYNPRVNEAVAAAPQMTELHPYQDEDTVQGILELIYKLDLMLRELSGMDRFVFHAGGGADAVFNHCCVLRSYFEAKGELQQRDEVITTFLTHPCDAACPATAGFKVITLMDDDNGYPSLDALKAACSDRTAGLLVVNPNDTGLYCAEMDKWVETVHDAGGLCFYDQANFNGVMGISRAADVGFDACMFMLHKTFGAPKGGMGPATGAYGVKAKLEPYLPTPVVTYDGERYHLNYDPRRSMGKAREFFGNSQIMLKAYAWLRSMGADGIMEARDLSVIGNNYLEKLLMQIQGVSRSFDHIKKRRLEMTRMSWEQLKKDTGVGTVDVQNRMTDFGIDAYWLSHEPWIVPEPFTPETGETWPKEDIDYWAAVLQHISDEAYSRPEVVTAAPHNQAIHKINAEPLNDPKKAAMTWRAYRRKNAGQ
jgi:glycine dehydrogenase subunit 2